jgi:uncharacterized membrane protein
MQTVSPSSSYSEAFHHKPFVWLRNKLLAGMALALPIMVTYWILESVYGLLKGWSEPMLISAAGIVNRFAGSTVVDLDSDMFHQITRFVGVLIPLLAFVFLGVMATNFIGVRVVQAMDRLMLSLPVVSFIYKSLKQVIDAFKGFGTKQNFQRVVYVDYPVGGMKMLGFVTGQYLDASNDQMMTAVFVPGALSPMTGLLLVVEEDKVTDAPMSIEDAMKLVFSGGLVVPASRPRPKTEQSEALAAAAAAEAEKITSEARAKDLPPNLPRAEDFDFGDPDILASAAEIDHRTLVGAGRKGWTSVLPWRRRG